MLLVIVFAFEILIFTKNNIFIYIFFRHFHSHNSEIYTSDHVHTLRTDVVPKLFLLWIGFMSILHTALMLCVTQIGAISFRLNGAKQFQNRQTF